MLNESDVERARQLYLKRPSKVVAHPPKQRTIIIESPSEIIQGGELIHEHLDHLLETSDPGAIRWGVDEYIDWLDGKSTTSWTEFGLDVLLWGDPKNRNPHALANAKTLMCPTLDDKEHIDLALRMGFPGVILDNGIEGSMEYGRYVHARYESLGRVVYFRPHQMTIARLVVHAYGIDTLMETRRIEVIDAFTGLKFEQMNDGRQPGPWDRVSDSSVIRLS